MNMFPKSVLEQLPIKNNLKLIDKGSVSQIELYGAILNQITDSVIISDSENRIVYVNHAFTLLTQYLPDEVIGKKPSLLKSEVTPNSLHVELWGSLNETGKWTGKIWNRKKNGTLFQENQIITKVNLFNETYYVSTFSDNSQYLLNEGAKEYLRKYDTPTNLPNAARLEEYLDVQIDNQLTFYLYIISIPALIEVRVNFGISFFEKVLAYVVKQLASMGTYKTFLARLCEEKFALTTSSEHSIETIINLIYTILTKPIIIDNNEIELRFKVGIVKVTDCNSNAKIILSNAKHALHEAKNNNELTYYVFNTVFKLKAEKDYFIVQKINESLKNFDFQMYYQPQVSLIDDKLCGGEALIRWIHNEKVITPNGFLPQAEKFGLLPKIDLYVLEKVLSDIANMKSLKLNPPQIAINISAKLIPVEHILFMLEKYKLSPTNIKIEVTENMAMSSDNQLFEYINELNENGIQSSIDDFGTGFSSLARLKDMPFHQLKIDKQFIDNIENKISSRKVNESIIAIAKIFGKEVLAEGVENNDQIELLKKMGCDAFQGYVHSLPLSLDSFKKYLRVNEEKPILKLIRE